MQEEPIQNRINENIGNIREKIQENFEPIRNVINDGIENAKENIENVKETVSNRVSSVNNVLNDFSSKNVINAGSDYLNSNSIIAKFSFVILILILFVFLFNLGIKLVSYFTSPSTSPYIVKGLIDGTNGMVIDQNPNNPSSITIQRSNNNNSGIEFTWSVWLYVSSVDTNSNQYLNVFNKGDSSWKTNGLSSVNNGPGLYLINPKNPDNSTSELGLYVIMDTENMSEKSSQNMKISGIPIQKWFNVCIRMENVIMDVYVNGTNSGRIILPYVPRQNYNSINVCQNGGFSGKLSDLRYFDHALSIYEINTLIWKGPNNTLNSNAVSNNGTTYSSGTNYISNLWYINKLNS